MRRLVVALALVVLGALAGAPAAGAVEFPPIPNPIGGVGDAILDKICPPREAPYPESPGDPVIKRGGGPGLYATYGYAGLRWTTWDAGCLSWDKADTSMGTQINSVSSAWDETINEVQMAALDDDTTASFDRVIERAVVGLRAAFWNPWSMVGFAIVGLLVVGYLVSGRETDAWGVAGAALVVLALVFLMFRQPSLPADVGNGMTSGVAQRVADSLIAVTPTSGGLPASATPEERFGEGFYQVSHRAWLEGWSCGDRDAEARYGARLIDAQAFSVPQYLSTRNDPEAAAALVKSKAEAWEAIGEQMAKTNPVAFGCWKGEGQSRTGAAIKHAVVTASAGFWIILGSVALLALKWVLRLAVLFFVAFGPLLLFSRRLQDRMMEFVLLGLVGPPFVAAAVGTLLWGYYAILLDREQAWWQAGVSAFALGLAVWFGKGMLQRLFVGASEFSRSGRGLRAGGKRIRSSLATHGIGTFNGGRSTASAAAAGAAAGGAVAGAVIAHQMTDDGPRRDDGGDGTHTGMEDQVMHDHDTPRMPPPGDGWRQEPDAAAQALERQRGLAAARGHRPIPGYRTDGLVDTDDNPRDAAPGSAVTAPTVEEVRAVVSGDPEYGRGDT